MEHLLNDFDSLPKGQRNKALKLLLDRLDDDQLYQLETILKSKTTIDPISKLPPEIVRLVLSYIDPRLLLFKFASLNHQWYNHIVGDLLLWRYFIRSNKSLTNASKEQSLDHHSIPSLISSFHYQSQLEHNWKTNLCRTWSIECHGNHVVTCVQVDGDRVITGADDGTIKIWDGSTGKLQRTLNGHSGGVWALKAFGDILVTGSTDRTLIIWDLREGNHRILIGHTSTVRCLEIVEGKWIVSGSRDGTLRVWDIHTGRCVHLLQGHTASVRCIAVIGRISRNDKIENQDETRNGIETEIRNGSNRASNNQIGNQRDKSAIKSSLPSPLIVSGSYDHTCRIWDIEQGQCVSILRGHNNRIYSISTMRGLIYSGSQDSTVRVWCASTGQCIRVLGNHRALVGMLQTSSDRLITASTDGTLTVQDISLAHSPTNAFLDRTIMRLPGAHPSSITAMDINSMIIATGSENFVRFWNITTGATISNNVLDEQVDMVWRIALGDRISVIAYQSAGQSRIDILDFTPKI